MKSPDAPVVTSFSPKMSSSATRPPSATAIWFSRYERLQIHTGRHSVWLKPYQLWQRMDIIATTSTSCASVEATGHKLRVPLRMHLS